MVVKLLAAYAYFTIYQELGLDYESIYNSYCAPEIRGRTLGVLNAFHNIVFRNGCFLGEAAYFWFFVTLQTFLLIVAFNKLYEGLRNSGKLLFLVIYFSPTILFFSSPPTKDGFFVFFTCLAIILISRFSNLFFSMSALIKPYFFGFLALQQKNKLLRLLLIIVVLAFFYIFFDSILQVFNVKASFLSLTEIRLVTTDIVWISEILLVSLVAGFTNIVCRRDMFLLLILCGFASGVSFNVASRIFSSCILFFMGLKLSYNTRA